MRSIAQLFKALSEETRLEILALLFRHGELCVCDVEEVLAVTQSKASRHLRYLLAAGLVVDRRDGLWVRYSIPHTLTPEQCRVLDAAGALLTPARAARVEARYEAWMARKAREGPGDARLVALERAGARAG
jgi:ArsR family transcriptional regulator